MPDADAQRAIDDITERYRCRIHTFAADVGDEAQVEAAAGADPGGACRRSRGWHTWRACSTMRCYHSRTWNVSGRRWHQKRLARHYLHRLTKNDDLDFFIVYSSASSVLGSPGQANYATANALLDGLVADRKAQGLPATGINWGPWAKGGMATSHAARANLSAQGLIPLEPTAALSALDEIVAHGTGQATVIKANWQRAAKGGLGASRPAILDHVLPSAVAATRGDSELLRQLHEVPEAERGSFLTEYLRHEVQNFLRLAQPPAATSRFLELGTDSLMAVEFSNRLLPQFGGAFTISATAVFDYPTIGSLAEYLAGQVPESVEERRGIRRCVRACTLIEGTAGGIRESRVTVATRHAGRGSTVRHPPRYRRAGRPGPWRSTLRSPRDHGSATGTTLCRPCTQLRSQYSVLQQARPQLLVDRRPR